jgi:DUF4097 and DUF4098 domain-containing protein YvlB
MPRTHCVAAVAALSLLATTASAQSRRYDSDDDWCRDGSRGRQARHCEVRESTMQGVNPIDIDAGQNGGIKLRGWDRADVLVRARIEAYAESDAEARSLASGVRIETTGTSVRAEGPSTRDRDNQHWSVSFDIQVPRAAMVTLRTVNGGISIDDFHGTAKFRASNGGVSLTNVGGDISGQTTNGGVTVNLEGDRWDGAGLDVETHNGGVRMTVPDNYSAVLDTGTVNGRINVDFPITVQGRLSDRFTTTLGSGGARVRVITTNGGVTIRRR